MLVVMAEGALLVASLGPHSKANLDSLVQLVLVEEGPLAHSQLHSIIWGLDQVLMVPQDHDLRVVFLQIMLVVHNKHQAALDLVTEWGPIKAQELGDHKECRRWGQTRWGPGLVLVDSLDMACHQSNRVDNNNIQDR